ncbi:ureidoglycolate lyase [Pantanalinema rosaneae CENA516]|uniref:ureidoglycolate lyase n=1 Tax=Pantanalinema rosaneae TaxID=1620701 RepID=UPI003D6E89D8
METYLLQRLPALDITPDRFKPYGQVIFASDDGRPYGEDDAQLQLQHGIPRLYIMRLYKRGRRFSKITRHQRCTQCLGSLEGKDWLMGVASANSLDEPTWDDITAFRIPGNCFIKLHIGTWHAGPYFDHEFVDFYNLELSDTNLTDHQTCDLREMYNVEFEMIYRSSIES